jgi:hypothetical protein
MQYGVASGYTTRGQFAIQTKVSDAGSLKAEASRDAAGQRAREVQPQTGDKFVVPLSPDGRCSSCGRMMFLHAVASHAASPTTSTSRRYSRPLSRPATSSTWRPQTSRRSFREKSSAPGPRRRRHRSESHISTVEARITVRRTKVHRLVSLLDDVPPRSLKVGREDDVAVLPHRCANT